MNEITEHNYMEDIELNDVPLWVTFSGLPIEYLSWEAVRVIVNMASRVDDATPGSSHARRHLGLNAKNLLRHPHAPSGGSPGAGFDCQRSFHQIYI